MKKIITLFFIIVFTQTLAQNNNQLVSEIIKNPKHEEYKATKAWAGRKFNPEVFNPSKVIFKNPNSRLKAWGY